MSKVSYATHMGSRRAQEDTFVWDETPEGILLAVFDGHGGDETSKTLAAHLPGWWSALGGLNYAGAMKKVFEAAASITNHQHSGSTASVVFIARDLKSATVGVIGDSPVLIEKPDGSLFVGPDHNVRSNMEERSAAISRGGLYSMGYIWNDVGELGDGLQMGRALGDASMGKVLDRTPEIMTIPLGNFLLVASDGLFDPMHKKQSHAVGAVIDSLHAGYGVKELVDAAVATPTNDNVTAILWSR